MQTAELDLFLFDLAGTTVRDQGYVSEAFEATAAGAGLEVDPDRLRARMGWHKQRVFESLLDEAGHDTEGASALADRFEQHFAGLVEERGLEPTPAAEEVIDTLLTMGMGVGFTTGFSRRTADLVLATMGWSGMLSVASDEVERGRPAPDLIQAAMRRAGRREVSRVGVAGDTPSDLAAGTTAGCGVVVGVGCGTHTLEELATSAHTHLLADLSSLPELWEH